MSSIRAAGKREARAGEITRSQMRYYGRTVLMRASWPDAVDTRPFFDLTAENKLAACRTDCTLAEQVIRNYGSSLRPYFTLLLAKLHAGHTTDVTWN